MKGCQCCRCCRSLFRLRCCRRRWQRLQRRQQRRFSRFCGLLFEHHPSPDARFAIFTVRCCLLTAPSGREQRSGDNKSSSSSSGKAQAAVRVSLGRCRFRRHRHTLDEARTFAFNSARLRCVKWESSPTSAAKTRSLALYNRQSHNLISSLNPSIKLYW